MKIEIEKSLVEFFPESADEKAKIEALWRMLVDCNGFNKKLTPVGEYAPLKNKKSATFAIEELIGEKSDYPEVCLESDARVYCKTCNNLLDLKKGDVLPLCCGKLMEILD